MCEHKRLKLRGHTKPDGLSKDDIWITDLSLVCLGCGMHLMYIPDDLTCIINIPHPPKDKCEHPFNTCSYPLNGFGEWTCLQCGEKGVQSTTHKLEIKPNQALETDGQKDGYHSV